MKSAALFITFLLLPFGLKAQDAPLANIGDAVAGFEKALEVTQTESSEARQRLAVRRVIRDAEQLIAKNPQDNSRFPVLEFLFRARQQLIALDKDPKHRADLLEICRELSKAPDEFADLRVEADLLLSQADLAKRGATNAERAQALRPFVERYFDTPAESKVMRMAMGLALEIGDSRLISYLQETIEFRFAGDLEMIKFLRDKLGGQVIGTPFVGTFERSDGKIVRYPMEGLGRKTLLVFWTNNERGQSLLKGIAATARARKIDLAGRIEIVSINLDDLPDAGESFVRSLGSGLESAAPAWREKHPLYDAYARTEQRLVTVGPTGFAALVMPEQGSGTPPPANLVPDFTRSFQSFTSREWTYPRYLSQITSLVIGEFLVIDPEVGLDPAQPPELKATAKNGEAEPLKRDSSCVPAELLQKSKLASSPPPFRYRLPLVESSAASHPVVEGFPEHLRLPLAESRANYAKAVEVCRKAISDHPSATDLWIVRNRLITALMGLWKCDSDIRHLEAAVVEAKAAISAGLPKGCDTIARFCVARGELLNPSVNVKEIIRKFVSDAGSDNAPDTVIACASLLALDAGDRLNFENLKSRILQNHTEHPMMWTYSAFLLDRYHDYWTFQVPFSAGWTFDRRQGYFMTQGYADDAKRMLRTELKTADGKILRIPEDLEKEWTIFMFAQAEPWSKKREDGLPESPEALLINMNKFAQARPHSDVGVMMAMLSGDAATTRETLLNGRCQFDGPVLSVPDGMNNPLMHRLGILAPDEKINTVLIRKDGWIAAVVSGLAEQSGPRGITICNVVENEDETTIMAMLERGEIQAARDKMLALAPPYDPNAVDAKGRKLPEPQFSTAHLRARARVYMALKEWEKAKEDAAVVAQRQLETDGWLSLRTPELDAAEALKAAILEQTAKP